MVDTTAVKPEPNRLKELKKNKSATATPSNPLKDNINISCFVNFGNGIDRTKIVIMNPNTPTKFLSTFSWMLFIFLDEISNRITAEDQQSAVKIA